MARFIMPDGADTELLQVHERERGNLDPFIVGSGCFCGEPVGGDLRVNGGFCHYCLMKLPNEYSRLLWPDPRIRNTYDFLGAYGTCKNYLKSIGVRDAEEDTYNEVLAGLPIELQQAILGE